jgi:protease IV
MFAKIFLSAFILFSISLPAQTYYSQNELWPTSPGAMKYGLYGYDNPALLSTVDNMDIYFAWSDKTGEWNDFNNWGLFTALPNFGFGFVRNQLFNFSVTDYKISSAFGDNSFSLGLGFGWSGGDISFFERSSVIVIGSMIRPNPYLSAGLIGNIFTKKSNEGVIDLAVRPFGNEIVSVFGDYVIKSSRLPGEPEWSAGAAFEVFPGIRLTGRYFDTKFFSAGIQLSFGGFGISTRANYNDNGDHLYNVYGIRAGAFDRNPFRKIFSKRNYAEINLLGQTKYRRFRFFDSSNTLLDLLKQIDAAQKDKSVSGIAINTSGMVMNREMIWELRERLKIFKSSGKKVVVYVDRPSINIYHLASVADKILMDPVGTIALEGYLLGRSYYKGTLQKVGIGFTELRYFKYKSAYETFSRESLSEADKEQLQAIADDFYETARKDITEGRNISPVVFNDLVDDYVLFLPKEALEKGLVDELGRWDKVKDLLKELEGGSGGLKDAASLSEFKLPKDNYWGEKPKIAVVYALGVCAMDEGITARKLVKDIEAVCKNNNVKALVLRVDSPGGDALASDIIAEALKKCKENKPVIVSQGYVAASGGYWLSMYADTIVAAPVTITGSIGVIGGWFYNKEFKEKLGGATDFVKRGEHADLGYGFTLPLIGITIPDRDLSDKEKEKAENMIKAFYDDFVSKVAYGRNNSIEKIDKIARGRVWSGKDGLNLNLVDVLGGLKDAINIAVKKAGIKDDNYEIIELPEAPFFDLSKFMPRIFGLKIEETNKFMDYMKFRLRNNGVIMPLLDLHEPDMLISE